jgi:hypothetical protein
VFTLTAEWFSAVNCMEGETPPPPWIRMSVVMHGDAATPDLSMEGFIKPGWILL